MEKATRGGGLGKIQLLSFAHVELEVSISYLNRSVTLTFEYTNLETASAYRMKTRKLE